MAAIIRAAARYVSLSRLTAIDSRRPSRVASQRDLHERRAKRRVLAGFPSRRTRIAVGLESLTYGRVAGSERHGAWWATACSDAAVPESHKSRAAAPTAGDGAASRPPRESC